MLKTLAAALIATSMLAVPVLAAEGAKDAVAPVTKLHKKHYAHHHYRHHFRHHVTKHKHHYVAKVKHHHLAKVSTPSKGSKADR